MKVFAHSFTREIDSPTFLIHIKIGKESVDVNVKIKVVKYGKGTINVVQSDKNFSKKILFHGVIKRNLGVLASNIYNNEEVVFPVYLGSLTES